MSPFVPNGWVLLAPRERFELSSLRLTAACSTKLSYLGTGCATYRRCCSAGKSDGLAACGVWLFLEMVVRRGIGPLLEA